MPNGQPPTHAPLAPPARAPAAGADRHRRRAEDLSRGTRLADRPEVRDRLLPRQDRAGELRAVHRKTVLDALDVCRWETFVAVLGDLLHRCRRTPAAACRGRAACPAVRSSRRPVIRRCSPRCPRRRTAREGWGDAIASFHPALEDGRPRRAETRAGCRRSFGQAAVRHPADPRQHAGAGRGSRVRRRALPDGRGEPGNAAAPATPPIWSSSCSPLRT